MAYISKYKDLDGSTYDLKSKVTNGILYGQVDESSTATKFTASIPGVTEYYDGLAILLKNGVVTSASGFTLNINGLGAKHSYSNLAEATQDTTIFNINYTMLFIYDSTRVAGGGWICFRGYDANTNTIGYQVRTNSSTLPVSDQTGRYRLLFTSADGSKWVPANTESYTDATTKRDVNQRKIDPFGPIVYYSYTSVLSTGTKVGATYQWSQYVVTLGYSFNRTGAALSLSFPDSVYVKCNPQTDGSAIIDPAAPFVQALPSSEDGSIYIYLGRAYSATAIELTAHHPVYYYKNGAVRLWTNPAAQSFTFDTVPTSGSTNPVTSGGIYDSIAEKVVSIDGPIIAHQDTMTSFDGSSIQTRVGDLFIRGENFYFGGYILDNADNPTINVGFGLRHCGTLPMGMDYAVVFTGIGADASTGFLYAIGVILFGAQSQIIYRRILGLNAVSDLILDQVDTGINAWLLNHSIDSDNPIDSTPTANSLNLVTSGGVYAMIGDVESLLAAI